MMQTTTKYHRLADDIEDEQSASGSQTGLSYSRTCTSRLVILLATLFSASVVLNVLLLVHLSRTDRTGHDAACGLSLYAKLPEDTQMRFEMETDYSSTNETLADALWDSISTSHGAVALSDDFVTMKGLRPAQRFPWDESKGLYYVQGVHLMHCVKLIRRSYLEYERGIPQSQNAWHSRHCFDALRMGIMCSASDTPLPAQPPPLDTGMGQMLQCRSWDRLREWALAPERNACFLGAEEELPVQGWERYGSCPPGSPYQEVADRFLKDEIKAE